MKNKVKEIKRSLKITKSNHTYETVNIPTQELKKFDRTHAHHTKEIKANAGNIDREKYLTSIYYKIFPF